MQNAYSNLLALLFLLKLYLFQLKSRI